MAIVKRLCIVGARGMLGRELVRVCQESPARQSIECHALDLEEIDITDEDRVVDVIGRLRPDLLINAAGYIDVDGCESDQTLAVGTWRGDFEDTYPIASSKTVRYIIAIPAA